MAPKRLKMNQEPHFGFPKQEIVSGLQYGIVFFFFFFAKIDSQPVNIQ